MKIKNIIFLSFAMSIVSLLIIIWFALQSMIIVTATIAIILPILLGASLVGLVINLLFLGPMFKTINRLSAQTHRIANGEFNNIENVRSPKELADLAIDFNQMSDQLSDSFDKLKAADEEKNTMISQLSHDIKTPITSIRSQTEAILDHVVSDEEVPQYLESIQTQVMHLSQLTNDLQAITLMEGSRGRQRELKQVYLDQILVGILNGFQVEISKQKRELSIDFYPEIITIQSDEESIDRIIRNLLANALKFSAEGTSIRVVVRLQGKVVTISVIDEGIGISEADTVHVFERLYRVEQSRSKATGGSGLGLYISQQLAQQLGGALTVESQLGTGSNFTLTVPLNQWF